jgi:hypothetical protein
MTARRNLDEIISDYTETLIPAFFALSEERTLAEYGPRCPDFEPDCPCCAAWAFFDRNGVCPTIGQLRAFMRDA